MKTVFCLVAFTFTGIAAITHAQEVIVPDPGLMECLGCTYQRARKY